MSCTITAPGHATNLTGVKIGLAAGSDGRRSPVPVSRVDVAGGRVVITLPDGTVEARCHDAARLGALLDAERTAGTEPRALLSVHEHQLFLELDPEIHLIGIGTVYVAPESSTDVLAAFNLALPWHPDVPCGGTAEA